MAVVLKAQELAGLDLLVDGEFNRFDPQHPETDGKIDYFIRQLKNVRTNLSRPEEKKFEELIQMRFRSRPAGVVEGQIGDGTLNLEHDFLRARQLTDAPAEVHDDQPLHAGAGAGGPAIPFARGTGERPGGRAGGADPGHRRRVIQVNEEVLTGTPSDAPWAAEA